MYVTLYSIFKNLFLYRIQLKIKDLQMFYAFTIHKYAVPQNARDDVE